MSDVRVHILHPSGVDVWLDFASLDVTDSMIKRMLASGYRPVSNGAGGSNGECPKGPDGSPLCLKHNPVMEKRERQGDMWFSHKVTHPKTGAELFCRAVRHGPAERDGFLVE